MTLTDIGAASARARDLDQQVKTLTAELQRARALIDVATKRADAAEEAMRRTLRTIGQWNAPQRT